MSIFWTRSWCQAVVERGLYRALKELRQVEEAESAEFPSLSEESLEETMRDSRRQTWFNGFWIASNHRPRLTPKDAKNLTPKDGFGETKNLA
jgi:hypothetical protein